MTIIDGKAMAQRRREALAERVSAMQADGVQPSMVAVVLGADGGTAAYLKAQAKAAAAAGIAHRIERLLMTLVKRH